MKSVLLSGYYGFGNLGDELILKNIANLFREAGFSSIYAVSGNIEYSRAKHHGIEFINRDDYQAIVNVVKSIDLVTLGGGGLFQDYNRLETANLFENPKMGVHSYMNVPLIAHIHGKPVAYLFQGIGPLFTEDSRNFTKYAYSLCDYISVRDKDSVRLLEEIGIRDVVLSSDPTFLYPVENVKTRGERRRIGISLRQWVDKSVEERITNAFIDFLNSISGDYDFYFISFQDHDDQNTDSSIYRRMRSNLERQGNFVLIRSKDYSLEEIERLMAGFDFIMGMRLHSIIFAVKYGIPFIAIPYWNKVDNLLTETGLDDLSISIKEISGEKIKEKFISLISESSVIKKRIEEGMTLIEQRLQYDMDTMKDFFTDISGGKPISLPVEKPDEKAPLPVDWLNYKAYQEKLKRQFYKNRYSRFQINRILRGRNYKKIIFYPSPILWDVPLFQRPHQVFKELSKRGYLIFFLSPDPVADRAEPIREINENLYLIKDIDILYGLRDEAIILWITWTPNVVCKELFPNSTVVYDWIDELDVFGYYSKFMEIDHRKLLSSADIVLATSDPLFEEAKIVNPAALLVPNGVCIEDFRVEEDVIPEDMADALAEGKPVVGFYGLLGEWRMDYDLVNYLSRKCNDMNFVYIGPSYDGSSKKIKQTENVFLLGPKKYEELKYYLKHFDIAIITYKVNRVTNSVFPVKLCEYMAGGKPVVTTNMKECRKFKSVLISEDYEDFIKNMRKALLLKDNPDYLKILAQEAYSNTWEDRADKIISALDSERLPEPAGKEQIEERLSIVVEEVEAMQKLLNHSLYETESLNSKLAQATAEKDNLLNQKDSLLNQLNQTIIERDTLNSQLTQVSSERDNVSRILNGIYSSHFWKVASLYYRVRDRSIVLRSIYKVLRGLKRKIKSSPYPEYLSKFRSYAKRYGARKAIKKSLIKITGRSFSRVIINASEAKISRVPEIYAGGIRDKVSVILPVYNQANYLKEAIDGVLNQTYGDIELIIINDGSTDGVEKVMDMYISHPKVKIFIQENQKLPRALNNGFDHATGEFLTWTSADNIMLPNQIEELVRFLRENPDADMVFSDYQAIDDRGLPLNDPTFRPHNQDKNDRSIMRLPNVVTFENLHDSGDNFIGPSFMYRRHVAKIIGDYVHDTFGGEDYDYWLRLNSLFKIKHLNKILYKYRVHENTLNARAKELDLFRNIRRLLKRDKLRIDFYKKRFNIIWVGFGQKDHLLDVDDKTLLIFRYSLKNSSEVIKNLRNSKAVSICVMDEKIDEYLIDDEVLKICNYIITIDLNSFDVLYPLYGNKLFNIEDVEGNLELLVKMANSKLFNRGMGLSYEKKPASIYLEGRKLNIAFQVENFHRGGLEQVVYDLATHIHREKFNLCGVIVVNRSGLIGEKLMSKGIDILQVNNSLDAYKSILKNKKIDIINSHYSYFGLDKAAESGIGVIETIHNSYTWVDSEKIKEIKYSSRFINKYISVSRQVKNYHRRRFGIPFTRIEVIPNGLNLEGLNETGRSKFTRNSLGYNEIDFIFLNVASYNGIKCHHLMLSALKELIGNYPDIKLIFIGDILDRGLYNDICGRIKAEGLERNVKIMDFLDRIYLKDVYQMANCFILPSIHEGWSIAAMEAMFFRLPLILTEIGSARDIIEDNDIGIIVENPYEDILNLSPQDILELSKTKSAKNLSELKKAMLTIYKNREFWMGKARKGRDKVLNEFIIEKMVKKYEDQFIQTYYLYRKE